MRKACHPILGAVQRGTRRGETDQEKRFVIAQMGIEYSVPLLVPFALYGFLPRQSPGGDRAVMEDETRLNISQVVLPSLSTALHSSGYYSLVISFLLSLSLWMLYFSNSFS